MLHRERGFFVGGFSAFPISYRSLRPKAGECDNLLAISCLSASHAAYGSVRTEPVFMMLGHAAGAAASIAIDQNVTLQNVPYPALRERLLAEKQILEHKAKVEKAVVQSKPETTPVAAPNAQLVADVKALVEKKIIASGDYWLANAQKGQNCDGKQVEALLISMAGTFETVSTRADALRVLATHKVLASADYWQERATPDRKCSGDNVRAIIRNFVRASGVRK